MGALEVDGIPRRNRRGLIEATVARVPSPRMSGFPGEIAGASLKPAGLSSVGDIPAGFPGEIAGASLKRARLARVERRPRHGFPGEIAGASLKQSTRFAPSPPCRAIPRRNRRGLIEA